MGKATSHKFFSCSGDSILFLEANNISGHSIVLLKAEVEGPLCTSRSVERQGGLWICDRGPPKGS